MGPFFQHSRNKLKRSWWEIVLKAILLGQPRPQANFRYPSDRRGLGTEQDSEKVWYKMAKKSQFSEKTSQILLKASLSNI